MLRKSIFAVTLISSLAASSAFADTLVVEGIDTTTNTSAPTRGQSQTSVEAKLGVPVAKAAPVGQPPISSWEYQSFIVYFENDAVIHTVAKR